MITCGFVLDNEMDGGMGSITGMLRYNHDALGGVTGCEMGNKECLLKVLMQPLRAKARIVVLAVGVWLSEKDREGTPTGVDSVRVIRGVGRSGKLTV